MKILLSYYRTSPSLQATDSACDIATKAFHLFKSMNSLSKLLRLLSGGSHEQDEYEQPVVLLLKGVEEVLYVSRVLPPHLSLTERIDRAIFS